MPPRFHISAARSSLSLLRPAQCGSTTASISPASNAARDTIYRTRNGQSHRHNHHHASSTFRCMTALTPCNSAPYGRRMNSSASGSGSGSGSGKNETEQKQQEQALGPNQDHLPTVSEEAAAVHEIMDKKACGVVGGPELEQGTPVEDILKRDKDALKNMPKVMRDQIASKQNGAGSSRSYSTSARLQQEGSLEKGSSADPSHDTVASMIAAVDRSANTPEKTGVEGFKYEVPTLPIRRTENLDRRYEPLVEQFTKLLMKDGKLSLAQKVMAGVLDHLRTAPPPLINPARPLLPGPPAPQLPLNPILYLTLIIDSLAPLVRIRQQKGAGGGGTALPIPLPLSMRQRRRAAIKWILDSADRRRDNKFATRVANEVIATAEGRSSVWEKRAQIHKSATTARANVRRVVK